MVERTYCMLGTGNHDNLLSMASMSLTGWAPEQTSEQLSAKLTLSSVSAINFSDVQVFAEHEDEPREVQAVIHVKLGNVMQGTIAGGRRR